MRKEKTWLWHSQWDTLQDRDYAVPSMKWSGWVGWLGTVITALTVKTDSNCTLCSIKSQAVLEEEHCKDGILWCSAHIWYAGYWGQAVGSPGRFGRKKQFFIVIQERYNPADHFHVGFQRLPRGYSDLTWIRLLPFCQNFYPQPAVCKDVLTGLCCLWVRFWSFCYQFFT